MRLIGYIRVHLMANSMDLGWKHSSAPSALGPKPMGTASRIVSDIGVLGATDAVDRPGLAEGLAALQAREAQGLVVARLDRLARALTVQEATLAIIWRAGADVFAADHGLVLADDPDDPMRTALRQVVGVFAELDRRMVVKRLRDGRTAKSATGRKAVGAYAYGEQGLGRGRARDAVANPAESPVVRLILRRRAEGMSYREIAAHLDDQGLRPRRASQWSAMSVRSIVIRNGARFS